MFVPVVVPAHYGHTTVINKTIVYSDTVLNLKEKGRNLQVTSVSVNENLFERCIQYNSVFLSATKSNFLY